MSENGGKSKIGLIGLAVMGQVRGRIVTSIKKWDLRTKPYIYVEIDDCSRFLYSFFYFCLYVVDDGVGTLILCI